jgi:Tol biopolymer transport system component
MRMLMVACVGCMACGSVSEKSDAAVVDTKLVDARAIDAAGPPCDVTKPFGTPSIIDGVNTASQERWGFLSHDELTIYFSDVAATRTVYSATRASTTAAFGTAAPVGGINTGGSHEHPAITADGLIIVTDTNQFGGNTQTDIGLATRANVAQDFGAEATVANVDTTNQEVDPWISADGLTLLFGSDRVNQEYRVFMATRASSSSPFGTPVEVPGINDTAATDSGGVLSQDGLEIFFYSTRTGGSGQSDIWHATRASTTASFDAPTNVSELNTSNIELTSWLSPDRCRILFSSDRLGTYDLWMATRPQ